MERVKPIPRNVAGADMESYRPEVLSEDEPRYLRRQKPLEIRRRKFGGRAWVFYRRLLVWSASGLAGASVAFLAGRFLLYSPHMALLRSEQIELTGDRIVSRETVLQQFVRDRGHSVLGIPLDSRRAALEEIPWVESAVVQRILPNRIRVEIIERTPVAFLRNGRELALIDGHGVILDRPHGSDGDDWQFPIVTGLSENLPREERAKRIQTYQQFLNEVDLVRSGSADRVSEVDLGDSRNLRAIMNGLAAPGDAQAVTIHFGHNDFTAKYRMVLENFAQWQASIGRVESIDLQYARQVVLNPESAATTAARTK